MITAGWYGAAIAGSENEQSEIKEIAGELSDNPKLEDEGNAEKIAGKVQEKIGQVKKVLGKHSSCP